MKVGIVLIFCLIFGTYSATDVEVIRSGWNSTNVIRIGCPYTKTGRFSYFGQQFRQAWAMWQEWIHSKGGMMINNEYYGFEFVLIDIGAATMSEMIKSTTEVVKDMASGKYGLITAIIAPYSSDLTIATAANAPDILVLAPAAAADSVYTCSNKPDAYCFNSTSGRRFGNLFGMLEKASSYYDITLNLARIRQVKRIGLVWEDVTFGREVCDGARQRAEELQMEVLYNSAMSSVAGKNLKDIQPDIVLACGYYDTAIDLIKQLRQVEWTPNATTATTLIGHPALDGVKNYTRYLLGPSQWHASHHDVMYRERGDLWRRLGSIFMFVDSPTNPSAKQFRDQYFARTQQEPLYQTASNLASLYALSTSIIFSTFNMGGGGNRSSNAVRAGAPDSATLINRMSAVKLLPSFWGFIGFDDLGRMSDYEDFTNVQFDENNVVQVVTPIRIATADFSYPAPSFIQQQCIDANLCHGNGLCQRNGVCQCWSPYTGLNCSLLLSGQNITIQINNTVLDTKYVQVEKVRTILEQDRCKGLYIAFIVVLVILIVFVVVLAFLAHNRKQILSNLQRHGIGLRGHSPLDTKDDANLQVVPDNI